MQGTNNKTNLLKERRKERILVAAHRGNCCPKLVDNTLPAMEHTLNMGADILELDLFASKEGELFVFHTGLEKEFLHEDVDVEKMSSREIRRWRQYNRLGERTDQGIDAFEDVLKLTKDRCILNLDRCDNIFSLVGEQVKKHGMGSQILLKCEPTPGNLDQMEQGAPEYMFMPIMRYSLDGLEDALSRNLRVAGIELTFDDAAMVSEDRMKAWHEEGYLLWTNSLNVTNRTLNAGHDDQRSMAGHAREGWGWLIRHGFDIIQTDFTSELMEYLKSL